MSVRLRIGRVIIEGIPLDRAGAAGFRAALEGELRRLIAASGLPAAWRGAGVHPDAPAGAVSLAPGTSGAALGLKVARAVTGAPGPAGKGR